MNNDEFEYITPGSPIEQYLESLDTEIYQDKSDYKEIKPAPEPVLLDILGKDFNLSFFLSICVLITS